MQTEKDLTQPDVDQVAEAAEDLQDETLRWLLDMEMSEPEETLFAVEQEEYQDLGLTDYEAQVASRPMVRGRADADDLSTYVAEEIVISSDDSQSSDIYSGSRSSTEVVAEDDRYSEPMAIDFSRKFDDPAADSTPAFDDGMDILGLVDEEGQAAAAEARAPVGEMEVPDAEELEPVAFTEAPVTGTVNTPDALSVANEDALVLDEEIEDALFLAEPELADALGYVDAELDLPSVDGTDFEPGAVEIDALFDDLDSGEEVAEENPEEAVVGLLETEAPAGEGDTPEIPGDDFLGGDLTAEFSATGDEAPADIDAFFEDIDQLEDERGDIDDLEMQAFDVAESEEPEVIIAAAATPDASFEIEAEPMGEVVETAALHGAMEALSAEPAAALEAEEDSEVLYDVAAHMEEALDQPEAGTAWCIPEDIAFNHTSKSGTEIFADFLDAFIEEGSTELEKLEDAVGAWEQDVTSEPAFAHVARTLHTIKGIAKGVGLQFYGTLIHNFETLLEALPRPEAGEEAAYFRIVNVWLDAAVRGLDHVRDNRSDVASEFPQVPGAAPENAQTAAVESTAADAPTVEAAAVEAAAVEAATESEAAPAAPVQVQRKQRDKLLADEGARALAAQQSVRITPEKLDHLLNLSNQAQQLGVRTAQSTVRGKRASAELQARLQSVRAHITGITDRAIFSSRAGGGESSAELDALEMDQYTELQEAANILREGIEDLSDLVDIASRQNIQVEALLKQQSSVIASIGSAIRAARVIPVSRLMPGLRRLVRTVSTDLGKDVAFRVINEVGTLDRDDYARCQIVLEHMVRNALDHGIELPQDRKLAGKSGKGTISMDVRQVGANSVITLTDDGRGIDPDNMRQAARSKGLDVDVDALSDDEALRLIFHKGFSTAASVSEISGRGVGMDIVISELQQMGGDIQIESTVGEGTAFHIRIPSNVTVNGALQVSAGDSSYAIPLGGLIAVEHVLADDFFAAAENNGTLELGGMDCEPTYLATLCQSDNLPERKTWGATVPVIVAGSENRYMAIAIDHLEEALELVIRSLGSQFASVPGVAGAATTADGEAIVALDLNLLVDSVPAGNSLSLPAARDSDEPLLVMVVDDSRTQRMVATSQLENIGAETITAENGGVAIDLLNTTDRLPDIILLDVEMPVKDGIQTLREIRKSVRYSHVPVIMVTSRTGLKHRTMAQEAGCNGYMGKPFNFRMLVGQINELTGHRLQLS